MTKPSLDIRIAQALDLIGDQGNPTDTEGHPTRNAPSPLKVFLPFIKARRQRRIRRLKDSTSVNASEGTGISLPADRCWHSSGHQMQQGDQLEVTVHGRLFLSRPLEVSIGPHSCVWYRIGNGPIARLHQQQQTITADRDGDLQFQAALPGAFDTPCGALCTTPPPPAMKGELSLSLKPLDAATSPATAQTPAGWSYLWRIGEAGIFKHCEDDKSICCHTHGDVGILQYPIELPLDEQLSLSWEWLMESLPSELPEHIQPTHDYLSIAVEFDNGLDLTYMWSAHLTPGTIFQCPLPWWDKRETHWVLRTPKDGLQHWLSERRSLLSDYQKAIGGPLPKRVVKVWLIANSAFQNGQGICRYRQIFLENADGIHPVHTE